MNGLLDTHTFLWAALSPEKLSHNAQTSILDPANDIFVSVITFWEVCLKFALGKIELQGMTPEDLLDAATQMGFSVLPLAPEDAASFYRLPRLPHNDPFDRMLIWQAIREDLTLISKDADFAPYQEQGLRLLW